MTEKYLQMFNRFFNNEGRMSSTYKPVFLRALLDIGDLYDSEKSAKLIGRQWVEQQNNQIIVDLNFIAARFAKYYWDMEYSFRLRQSQDPQDANITRLIKAIHEPKKKPPTTKELSSDKMESFRKMVINKSIKREVLIHLRTDMKELYHKRDAKTIVLDETVIEFLYTHKTLLRKGLNNVIAKYLEKLNRMTPQISNKIDSENKTRQSLNSEIQIKMDKWQDSRCFYCRNKLKNPHVDHVIPYNYIFATDPHNCALACQQCNCIKSDMLPNKDLFENVIDRNRDIMKYLETINQPYDEKSYMRLFETCIDEYNGNTFFSPENYYK